MTKTAAFATALLVTLPAAGWSQPTEEEAGRFWNELVLPAMMIGGALVMVGGLYEAGTRCEDEGYLDLDGNWQDSKPDGVETRRSGISYWPDGTRLSMAERCDAYSTWEETKHYAGWGGIGFAVGAMGGLVVAAIIADPDIMDSVQRLGLEPFYRPSHFGGVEFGVALAVPVALRAPGYQ